MFQSNRSLQECQDGIKGSKNTPFSIVFYMSNRVIFIKDERTPNAAGVDQ